MPTKFMADSSRPTVIILTMTLDNVIYCKLFLVMISEEFYCHETVVYSHIPRIHMKNEDCIKV